MSSEEELIKKVKRKSIQEVFKRFMNMRIDYFPMFFASFLHFNKCTIIFYPGKWNAANEKRRNIQEFQFIAHPSWP